MTQEQNQSGFQEDFQEQEEERTLGQQMGGFQEGRVYPRNNYYPVWGSRNPDLKTPNIYSQKDGRHIISSGQWSLVGYIDEVDFFMSESYNDKERKTGEKNELSMAVRLVSLDSEEYPLVFHIGDQSIHQYQNQNMTVLGLLAEIAKMVQEDPSARDHRYQISAWRSNPKDDPEGRSFPRVGMRAPIGYNDQGIPEFPKEINIRFAKDDFPPRPIHTEQDGIKSVKVGHIPAWIAEKRALVEQVFGPQDANVYAEEDADVDDAQIAEELDTEGLDEDLQHAPQRNTP